MKNNSVNKLSHGLSNVRKTLGSVTEQTIKNVSKAVQNVDVHEIASTVGDTAGKAVQGIGTTAQSIGSKAEELSSAAVDKVKTAGANVSISQGR
jgi:hypothetical protein